MLQKMDKISIPGKNDVYLVFDMDDILSLNFYFLCRVVKLNVAESLCSEISKVKRHTDLSFLIQSSLCFLQSIPDISVAYILSNVYGALTRIFEVRI